MPFVTQHNTVQFLLFTFKGWYFTWPRSEDETEHATLYSRRDAMSVTMERWIPAHRAFVLEAYFKSNDSVVAAQRKFRLHFNVGRHGITNGIMSSINYHYLALH
jgi:hypothetical protein